MEIELTKEDNEYIESINKSTISNDKKIRLINMIKTNRVFMRSLLDIFDK